MPKPEMQEQTYFQESQIISCSISILERRKKMIPEEKIPRKDWKKALKKCRKIHKGIKARELFTPRADFKKTLRVSEEILDIIRKEARPF